MGNADSSYYSTVTEAWKHPEQQPKVIDKPTHEPKLGFQEERAERVSKISEEDMYRARLPPNRRDYCAENLIELYRCRKENYPSLGKCEHFKHDWDNCQNRDTIYRMKEFERERRLMKRDLRKKASVESEISE